MPEFPGTLKPPRLATAPAGPASGQMYWDTATSKLNVWNGTAWVDALAAAAAPSVGYGTTLPASPVDGQEAILVDSVTASNWQWRFRYNAGSTSPYKWEFVGGTPVTMFNGADETNAATNAWMDMPTVGPQFTVPRAGDYLASGGCTGWNGTAAAVVLIGITIDAGIPVDPLISEFYTWGANARAAGSMPGGRLNSLAAGNNARLRYYTSVAGLHVLRRSIVVTPIRVS